MVDHERKAIARLMTTLKFIKMQSLFLTMYSNHRHLTTTTAGILGQPVHEFPPTMCWLKMHFALWLSLWLPNPTNHLIHLDILSYMANQISPLAAHPDLLLPPVLIGPFTRLLRKRLQNNPSKSSSLKTLPKQPWIFWMVMIVILMLVSPLMSTAVPRAVCPLFLNRCNQWSPIRSYTTGLNSDKDSSLDDFTGPPQKRARANHTDPSVSREWYPWPDRIVRALALMSLTLALIFEHLDLFLRYSYAPPSFRLFPEATRSFSMVAANQQCWQCTIHQVDADYE